jgi:predicted NBD/HSP70 family sugar kinase
MKSLGIDIGGTSVKLAAVEDGATVWTGQSPFYTRPTTTQLIDAMRSAARDRVGSVPIAGLCVPGLYDKARRMITLSVNVPGLMNIVLDDLVAQAFGNGIGQLKIINDAVATATDVIRARGLRGRVVSIALGTGVGMGVLDDGTPLFIDGASPGHIGQVDCSIQGQDVIGPDGGAGSLEGYLGVPALVKRYGNMEEFFRLVSVTDAPMRALARAIRICHAIYRPHHVLIVGGVGTRLANLIPDLKQAVADHLTSIARPDWTLAAGDSDFHAARGAAYLATIA